MIDMSYLKKAQLYWDEWRFLPWADGTASGLYRRADFIKAGLIGEVGRYLADDYIVWSYEESDIDRIFNNAKPQKNLMLQRFIFVRENGETSYKNRSICFGFKGFVEIYRYTPLAQRPKQIADLGHLIDACHQYALRHEKDIAENH